MPDETNQSANFANGPTSASGRIKVAEKDYDEETRTFSINFADGASAEVPLDSLPANIVNLLALHGLSQKLGDSYASVKGNVADAKAKFEAVLTQLRNGEWKKAREAGEGGSNVTELAQAIAQFKGAPVEKAVAVVAKATPEQIKAWRGNAKIKAIIAEIRARKAAERAEKAGKEAGKETAESDLSDLVFDDESEDQPQQPA
jgi:hypothetical protein